MQKKQEKIYVSRLTHWETVNKYCLSVKYLYCLLLIFNQAQFPKRGIKNYLTSFV